MPTVVAAICPLEDQKRDEKRAMTIRNAEVSTATVEIQTVTIGGKQMTLSVFRQLKELDWLDEQGEPRGQAWGTVNYHPGGCESRNHVHLLWQLGDELRASSLRRPAWLKPYMDPDHWVDALIQAAYCVGGHAFDETAAYRPTRTTGWRGYQFYFEGIQCEANEPKRPLVAYSPAGTQIKDRSGHVCSTERDLKHAEDGLRAAIAEDQRRHARREDRWNEALRLPQLFIAV